MKRGNESVQAASGRGRGQGQGNDAAKIIWTAFLKCRPRVVQIQGLERNLAMATLVETLLALKIDS